MDKEKKQRLIIQVCCFIAAFCLWLYISNVENPIITYKIKNVPVKLKNIDYVKRAQFIIISDEEYTVNLMIKGNAADVRNIKPEDFDIAADMSAYVLKNEENRIPIEINKSPDNVSVVQNGDLWIKVNLDELVQKNFPVEISVKGSTKEGYYAYDPITKPTDVLVEGAARYINAVEKVSAEINIENKHDDVVSSVALRAKDSAGRIIEEVKVNTNIVDVIIPIDKINTADININSTGKLGEEYVLKSIKPEIGEIRILGDESIVNDIKSLQTELIDLTGISEDTTLEVPLIIPKGVKLLKTKPVVNVEIDIEKVITKEITSSVYFKNLEDGFQINSDKHLVSLVLQGEEGMINNLNYSIIKSNADLSGLKEGEYLLPISTYIPPDIKLVSKKPKLVKVLISKKDDEVNNTNNTDTNNTDTNNTDNNNNNNNIDTDNNIGNGDQETVNTNEMVENDIPKDTEEQNDNTGE